MVRKKKVDTTDEQNTVSSENKNNMDINISASVGAETSDTTLVGKKISLNQKVESFFGIGNIWLSHKDYSATVPKDISAQHLQIIEAALKRGALVLGEVYIPPIDKDEKVLEEYWHLVKTYGLKGSDESSPSMVAFRRLFKKGTDRNWTAKEVANFCLLREASYKNRLEVIRLLKDTHRYSTCPDTLLESL